MSDEVGTETTRSDALSADESLFGDKADDAAAAVADEQDADKEAEQDPQGSDDAGEQAAPPEDLKVVVSIKGGRATIGVQRPSADPHIESFDDLDESALTREVIGGDRKGASQVGRRAQASRLTRDPLPQPGVGTRRGQGAAAGRGRRGRGNPAAARDAEAVLGDARRRAGRRGPLDR